MKNYNPKEVLAYLHSLDHLQVGGCTEIRILPEEVRLQIKNKLEYVGRVVSGYYTDYEKAVQDIADYDGKANVYTTLNPCDPKLIRRAENKLILNAKQTTNDDEIIRISWLPLDFDPERPSGTASSEEELQAAISKREEVIEEVFSPLKAEVIRAVSGNGAHGLIKLPDYENTVENRGIVERAINYLAETYSDDQVKVDGTVFNPSRIWKLYGMKSTKGDPEATDAPQRRAEIDLPPEIIPFDVIAHLDRIVPKSSREVSQENGKAIPQYDLDVETYLLANGVEFRPSKEATIKGESAQTWRIICPFDSNHKYDAQVVKWRSGKLGFVCPHDSCKKNKGWQAFKAKVGDPAAFADSNRKSTRQNPSVFDSTEFSVGSHLQKTDEHFAETFIHLHGANVLWCQLWGKWLIWDGRRWEVDNRLGVGKMARDVARCFLEQAAGVDDNEKMNKLIKLGQSAATYVKQMAMLNLVKTQVPVAPDELDVDPMLLNTPTGTIDLTTGEVRPHNGNDKITKITKAVFEDINAKCPRWENFLNEILNNNAELLGFMQRAIGYALTGGIRENVLFIMHGDGANGKTTLVEAIMYVLGDYAKSAAPDLLLQKRNESHPTGVADLMGARFVSSVEVDDGRKLNEAQVKRLTGRDTVKARFMRQDFFDFSPSHKLFMAANHKPEVQGTDKGIWRRIRLIPFELKTNLLQ